MARIIVVEDEVVIARSIAKLLAVNGYEVVAIAATGAEAVAAAATHRPDLILMDVNLHGPMDGIEAALRIREARDIPIVFLTAYADRGHVERAKAAAPHGYLLKPYSDRELLTTVEVSLHKHRLERAVIERATWLGTTLRSLGDAVVAVDRELHITFLNGVAERLTGWAIADALGKDIHEVVRLIAEDRDGPRAMPLTQAIADGQIHGLDGPSLLVARDDTRLPVDSSVAPIIDANGDILGAVVVFRDVTERRVLERRLAIAERLASLATLTAGMGHELNNPLSYNLGNLELALIELPRLSGELAALATSDRDAVRRDALRTIGGSLDETIGLLRDALTGAERIREVVGKLREFASPGRGERGPVAIGDVVDTAIRLVQNELSQRAAVKVVRKARPIVVGSASRLVQVFSNLLANAAQAIPDTQRDGVITIVIDQTDDDAVVEITDNGSGIPPEVMIRIFEPFFTTKPMGLGSGLGLAIVHSVVAAHDGEVTVVSRPDEGSTFRVRLPRSRTTPAAVERPAPPAPPARRHLLIVDDDVTVARLLGRLLTPRFEVRVAASGAEAEALIAERAPDVILCDLMMPKMTGMELHARIRDRDAALAARMVFMTGGAFTESTQAFMSVMGDRVLLKPVPPEVLTDALDRVGR